MLTTLLRWSHTLHPDMVCEATSAAAAIIGGRDVVVHLVDHDQRRLVPVREERPELEVDSTVGGRAYRTNELVDTDAPAGGRRVWVPILDGAERMGVLALTVDALDELTRTRCWSLASLLGELLVSKVAYGDGLEQRRRRRAMDLSAEMRWSLLPPLTFTGKRVEISGVLQPAYEVAGDAFDYALNGDTAHLAVLDAMGHGLEASRIANLAVGAYRHCRRRGLDLVETFRALDVEVARAFGDERFVTGQLARLRLDSGHLTWVNAGHPRPLLLRGTRVLGELEAERCLPIGLGDVPAEVAEASLQPGDTILFFTDGVVEAHATGGDPFGLDRLADLLERAAAAALPAPEMLRRLSHAVVEHESGQLHDDATLLLVRWLGG